MKKVFLTVLGTGYYKDCYYYLGNKEYRSKFVQEALIKLLFTENDDIEVKVLLTEKAKRYNFDFNEERPNNLKEVLDKLGISPELIIVPEGKTEEELWSIFENTINSIEDNSQIIMDITHSLRNIPIQILVALNYLKLFKDINLDSIYYGAFELGKDIDDPLISSEKIRKSPICNLNIYYELLNWTNAINSFMNTGSSSQIINLYNDIYRDKKATIFKQGSKDEKNDLIALNDVVKSLDNFTQCINTCRGMDNPEVKKNTNLKSISCAANTLYNKLNVLNNNLTFIPLKYLFNKVKEIINPFIDKPSFEIGMETVNWCIRYSLYQQGYTALDESLKTFICDKLNLSEKNYKKYYRENIANTILVGLNKEVSQLRIDVENEEDILLIKNTVAKLKENTSFCDLVLKIKEKRNDINHFGYKDLNVTDYTKLSFSLKEYYNEFIDIKDHINLSYQL